MAVSAHPYRTPTLTPPVARWRIDWNACDPFSTPFVVQNIAYFVAFAAARRHGEAAQFVAANVAALVGNVACRALLGLRREVVS